MKIQFLGGVGTVTGSRTQLQTDRDTVWVDCGLFQGPKEIRERNWEPFDEAQRVSSVVLTHAHVDHSGLLPLLAKKGFRGPIYCTQATYDLCQIMLTDSGRLQEEDAEFANRQKYSNHDPALPLYTEKDAIDCLRLFNPIAYNQWLSIGSSRVRLSRSGHILGSAFVEVGYENHSGHRTILFSGDLACTDSLVLKDPFQCSEADEMVLESTYGDRVHERGDKFEQLAKVINTVIGRKGTLVIPAFAVGRTQEILFMIRTLEDRGQIESVPVYLDSPMALDATELYQKHIDELRPEIVKDQLVSPLVSGTFKTVHTVDESMLLCMDTSPKIVISAAGMLTGGRVLHHLKAKLPDEKSGVLFVGYQVPGSKGYLLKNGLRDIRIHHQKVDIEAEIFSMDSMSAHADSDQTMEWLGRFRKKPSRIFINHGEENARRTLAYRIRTEFGIQCELPQPKSEYKLGR